MQLNTATKETIIVECREVMTKNGFDDEQVEQFCGLVSDYLSDYDEQLDEEREITYTIRKVFDRIELKMSILGEEKDPFAQADKLSERRLDKALDGLLRNTRATATYRYRMGSNVIVVRSARKSSHGSILKQPTVLAVILGILAGVACSFLPSGILDFIVYELAAPLLSLIINMLTGIMGPIVFISLVISISSLEDINELTELGSTVIGRFVVVILTLTGFSMLVGLLFFPVFGKGGIGLDATAIVNLLLGVIPTNIVTPFVENNMPQLVVLGAVCGASLLLLGGHADPIKRAVMSLNDWVNMLLDLIMKLLPAIPFLSVFKITAVGDWGVLIEGWKYIVATYVCIVVCIAIKFVKASKRSGMRIAVIWKGMKPMVSTAFVTSSSTAALKMEYGVAEELGIDPSFSSFWVPLAYSMLIPSTTIGLVLSTLFIAYLTGTPMTISSLVVLAILNVELSLASPGMTSGTTVIVQSLGMPTDYVGTFSAYRMFIKNAAVAFSSAYKMLEQLEAASATGRLRVQEESATQDEDDER